MVCEFSQPVNGAFRKVYTEYLMRSLPPIARKVSSNPESYVYLAESIQAWPAQRELGERIAVGRLERGRLAQPDRRHRGAAPSGQAAEVGCEHALDARHRPGSGLGSPYW